MPGEPVVNSFKPPRKMPRWLGRIACWILNRHRWFGNSDNTWRFCSRCRIEEVRQRTEVWKD